MKDNDTPGSNRSYRTIPPALIDPYDEEALQKVQKSIDNASVRSHKSKRSPTDYQLPTYDPKVLKQHMRLINSKIFVKKYKDDMDLDHDGGDGGDGGGSVHSSSSNSTFFRSHRMKPPKNRPKCEKVKWDGLPSSFKRFRKEIEGHLLQVGAGYSTED